MNDLLGCMWWCWCDSLHWTDFLVISHTSRKKTCAPDDIMSMLVPTVHWNIIMSLLKGRSA